MVRMGAGGARASVSGEQASREKGSAAETSEGAAVLAGLASLSMPGSVPPAGGPPVELEPLPLVPLGPGQAASEEEEEDAGPAGPPLKRKRGELPPSSAGRAEAGKHAKGKGKVVAAKPGQWEPAITLSKNASIGDVDVSRYLAERVTPPVDERIYEKKDNHELGSELIRLGMRVATVSLATVQRLETLDQEVQDLHEQLKGLRDDLEGRDLLQAKNASLEEEKEALLARLTRAEEEREAERRDKEMERKEREVEKKEKQREVEEWKRTLREERELMKVLRRDCHLAAVDRDRAMKTLQEVRHSVRQQRIEAIKRWKRRFLYDECLELACDVSLGILKRGHQLYVPEGSPRPSFEDYARPLVPPELGLSLEEMMKRIEGEPTEAPDEGLDLSSEEEEPRVDAPSSPQGPTSALVVLLDEEEPLAAFSGPVPLPAEPPPSEVSPGRPHTSGYSPGYTPSPPAND